MATKPAPAEPSAFAQAVSRRVRQYVAGDKITQAQLAEQLGLDVSAVYRRLHNKRGAEFSLSELDRLAPLFHVPASELIPREV